MVFSFLISRGGNSQQFLAVQIFERCPDFHFHSKRKSGRPDFWKGVHIFNFFKSQIWPSRFLERCSHLRFWWKSKCEHLFCTDLDRKGVHILIFIKNENVNTFPKIWTARFAFWKKNENVNTYFCTTCSDLRFEIKWKSGHLSEIWTARNCWGFPPQDSKENSTQ